jgi:hypothetical protein
VLFSTQGALHLPPSPQAKQRTIFVATVPGQGEHQYHLVYMHMQDADAVRERTLRTSTRLVVFYESGLNPSKEERVACNLEALPCLLPSSSLGPAGCRAQHPWVVQQPAHAHEGDLNGQSSSKTKDNFGYDSTRSRRAPIPPNIRAHAGHTCTHG